VVDAANEVWFPVMVRHVKKSPASKAAKSGNVLPLGDKSLTEHAYEAIKHKIIVLDFPPGEYLNEAQVSETLGIGRTPVHQALTRLMLEGMVEVIPRKGVIVKSVSLNEIMEIIDVRLINEPHATRLAATFADEDDIEKLNDILNLAEEAASRMNVETQMILDKRFHCAISAAVKNTVLADLLKRLHERSLRFWFISLRDAEHHAEVIREHRRIFEAVKARDPDAAAAAARDHIESFRRNITRQV